MRLSRLAASWISMSAPKPAAATATAIPATSLDLVGAKGEFKRSDAAWRNWIKNDASADFPAAAGRYHLYVSFACPWAHRTLMVRSLKGLQSAISVTAVHPTWQRTRPDSPADAHAGWIFGNPDSQATIVNKDGKGGPFPVAFPAADVDPLGQAVTIRDVYERASGGGYDGGVYSVPILWDKVKNTIVSNESSEIIRMLNAEFNDVATNPDLDLYPVDLRPAIDAANEWVYPMINNGVYRCGFAKSQEAYDEAIIVLTEGFDRLEALLQKQRYLCGDRFTEADVRLFVTLVRLDEVYIVYFKCNTRSVEYSDAILNYCREIYQMPGIPETVRMDHIKAHYFTSHPHLNHFSIIPKGRDFCQLLEQPHNRHLL